MAIDDITTRIIAEAKDAAEKILAEARSEADQIKNKAAERLETSRETANQKAEVEARSVEQRIIAGAELEAQKSILAARQAAITATIERAVESLQNMDETEYVDFVASVLTKAPIDDKAEIIVENQNWNIIKKSLPELKKRLESTGRRLDLTLAKETREIGGGVLLRKGRIEFNASLPAIRRGMEEELRSVAASILFPSIENG